MLNGEETASRREVREVRKAAVEAINADPTYLLGGDHFIHHYQVCVLMHVQVLNNNYFKLLVY